jgi:S1-C subfamily serine protease
VITNWGLLPADIAAAEPLRRAHFDRSLGRVLPEAFTLPPFGADDGPAAPARTTAPASSAAPPASSLAAGGARAAGLAAGESMAASVVAGGSTAGGPAAADNPAPEAVAAVPPESPAPQPDPQVAPQVVTLVESDAAPPARPWLPVAIATAIAALLLLILLIPGVLRYPAALPAARAVDPAVIAQTRQTLERRLESLQVTLRQGTCVPPSSASADPRRPGPPAAAEQTPGQQIPGQQTPTAPVQSAALPPATQPLVPPSPERIATPSAGGQPTNLIAWLDRVTALIVAPKRGGGGASFGSGFFIDEHHLVTNSHVVEEADPGRVFVVNKAFGHAIEGRVTTSSRSSVIGSNDFAVIEISGAEGTPVKLTNSATRGDSVVAAGFPGFVMRSDQVFKRLMEGDFSSLPDPVVTQGWITATQTSERGLPVLVHGATISQGNSGGPLTDLCGRVVGVNTYGSVDQENALRLNFALRSEGLRRFLDDRHIAYSADDTACQPAAMPPATAAAAPPGASAPGTPPPDASAPGTPPPGVSAPGTPPPGVSAPGTPPPGVSAPGTPAQGASAPGASAPGTSAGDNPAAADGQARRPASVQP